MSEIVTAAILISFGLLYIVMPDWAIKFNIWQTKKILGAKFVPGKRTETVYRFLGLVLFLIGIYVMFKSQ